MTKKEMVDKLAQELQSISNVTAELLVQADSLTHTMKRLKKLSK